MIFKLCCIIPIIVFCIGSGTGKSIVYFSSDNGNSWQDKSDGLPAPIVLTDIAVSADILAIASKQQGIYVYDFVKLKWMPLAAKPATNSDLDALYVRDNNFIAGTHGDGVFVSNSNGAKWKAMNAGLGNLTIRKLVEIDHQLYAGTNGGLYVYLDKENKWVLEFGTVSLQVNGITVLDGEIFIGTNQGVYKSIKGMNNWIKIMPNQSLHNISADDKTVYAMVYSELFVSTDKGRSWQSDQRGMPAGMYSFHVTRKDNALFVAQWDGVYRKSGGSSWTLTSKGMPSKFPVTELKVFKNLIIAGSSGWVNK
jgi:ligand-binding sensor domain-containing protein